MMKGACELPVLQKAATVTTALNKKYLRPTPTPRGNRMDAHVSSSDISNKTSSFTNSQANSLSPWCPRSESGSPSSGWALVDCGIDCHIASVPAGNTATNEKEDINSQRWLHLTKHAESKLPNVLTAAVVAATRPSGLD